MRRETAGTAGPLLLGDLGLDGTLSSRDLGILTEETESKSLLYPLLALHRPLNLGAQQALPVLLPPTGKALHESLRLGDGMPAWNRNPAPESGS